jgi:Dolichyl-phosphate-mannose-protein mannosyltransferase
LQISDIGRLLPRDRILLLAALIATLLVYAPTLTFPFAADDASQILGNPRVHSWQFAPEYFKSHVWGHLTLGKGERGAAYYRPLFLLWELVIWTVFGTNTAGWHFSALALHLLATGLVYFAVRRVAEDSLGAFAASLLFGVYPIHVEGVTWISGATEPLAAIPFLGSVLCWLRAHASMRPLAWRAGSVMLYGIALLAKETAVVLPAVLLAFEILVRRRQEGMLRRMLPYAGVGLLYIAVRQVALGGHCANADSSKRVAPDVAVRPVVLCEARSFSHSAEPYLRCRSGEPVQLERSGPTSNSGRRGVRVGGLLCRHEPRRPFCRGLGCPHPLTSAIPASVFTVRART